MSSIPASAAPADIVGYSIVLVGQFDPGQAQPSLLAKAGLLDEGDLSDLTYDMLVKDLVVAKLPWIAFTIERTKLAALTTLQFPVAEPVRDFVLDLIELMPSKRYTALGINRDTHMPLRSRELYQALLDKLAGSPNRDSLSDDVYEGALLRPVPLSLTIQGQRDDGARGTVTVRVEPSLQVFPGVYIQINDHFDANPDTLDAEPEQLLERLTERWSNSMMRTQRIISAIRNQIYALT